MCKELTLKEIQQGSFDVLLKLREICNSNGFKFYLAYGTLIGAVRHSNFIPWDDDIDIWMPREDYEKFILFCKQHENDIKPYRILHYSTAKHYPYSILRFSNSDYIIDYDGVKDYGLGLFVDIYPLDYVPSNYIKYHKKLSKQIMRIKRINFVDNNFFKRFIRKIYTCLVLLLSFKFTIKRYIKNTDLEAQKYNGTKSNKLCVNCWEIKSGIMDENDIFGNDDKFMLFNGVMMPVPYNYDKILKSKYGDYTILPPENERIGHHCYKAYKK